MKLILFIVIAVLALSSHSPLRSQSHDMTFAANWFLLINEFVGQDPLQDMKNNFKNGLANGFQINRCSLSTPLTEFLNSNRLGFSHLLPASVGVLKRFDGSPDQSQEYIAGQLNKMRRTSSSMGNHKVWWNLMPEYDQLSGYWSHGRNLQYTSRSLAFSSWRNFYLQEHYPLGTYLKTDREARGVSLLALNVHSFATHYSFELGVDACVLERSNDDIGDIQTGISFVRGAARQYNKPWGIDISHWRRASDSPTEYDDQLRLKGGWSPSYLRRHLFISYMSGANLLLLEGLVYENSSRPNPSSNVIKEFADFSLVRHAAVGKPLVHTALMLDFHHGFEPKYGRYQQGNHVWYGHIPYDDGDFMTHAFFDMIFPEYWKTGTLPKSAPPSSSAYRQALASGVDPRPWEPMGQSRWGDHYDVILSNATLETLRNYKTIFLVGNINVFSDLQSRLKSWVGDGGTLVINSSQIRIEDADFYGVRFTGTQKYAASSRWLVDSTWYSEHAYRYHLVSLMSAVALADNEHGDAVITRNRVGEGEVILTLPHYMLNEERKRLLAIGYRVASSLADRYTEATVTGPFMIQYIVNKDDGKTIVTLVNNSEMRWRGTITFKRPHTKFVTREWLADTTVTNAVSGEKVILQATVPAYDLRIYALEPAGKKDSD